MFVSFFVHRPVFSSVCALLIVLVGALAIPNLPVAQYPSLALPQVNVVSVYTGASAEVVESAVTTPLEQQINGVEGMKYITSSSSSDGVSNISIIFNPGRNVDVAAVDVQNRVQTASGQLPSDVRQNGISITKTAGSFVAGIALYDESGQYNEQFVSNYAEIYMRDALKRLKGVGSVDVFGARRFSMRVWLDPAKLASRNLTPLDVVAALREQNLQVAAGQIGRPPAPKGQQFQLNVVAKGRLSDPKEFEDVVLKGGGTKGALVRLKDVARIELGAEDYAQLLQFNGRNTAGLGITQLPNANALDVAERVKAELARLSKQFPKGLKYEVAFDSTLAVEQSIHEVLVTLAEAIVLVVLVILVFLKGLRATLIPTIVIPISLIGTFAFVKLMGFSINTLTLFGLTLATGLVVDDAIVVIENISRHLEMSKDKTPIQAAVEGMSEVVGPVIAISLVLVAVFVPVSFFPGSTGIIYQQFALTIAFSVAISTFISVTLTPALSGLMLKHTGENTWAFFQGVDRALDALQRGYAKALQPLIRRPLVGLALFLALIGATGFLYTRVPSGFIPDEDQGWFIVAVNAPDGSSLEQTGSVLKRAQEILGDQPEIRGVFAVGGFSFGGSGPNRGVMFVNMKPWGERPGKEHSVAAVVERLRAPLSQITDAMVMPFPPPSVEGVGAIGGFQLEIEDRALQSNLQQIAEATREVLEKAAGTPEIGGVFSTFTADDPQILVEVDRERARAMDIDISQLFGTLQVSLSAQYVNDFDFANRAYRVLVQNEAADRDNPSDIGSLYVRTNQGAMVPLDSVVKVTPTTSAQVINHFNLFRAVEISGSAAPGYSSGQALAAMEKVAKEALPQGFGYEWSGLSLEELESGGQTGIIFLLGLLFVFLVLAAQYESFALPFVVVLSVPLAILGALGGQALRGLPNDVFCQVGMVMLVGLSSKNAILIVELARRLRSEGATAVDAALQACSLRLRPILMTSIAFLLGVMPLMFAKGAGSAARSSLGTAVFGGMLVSTVLNLFFTPVLFVLVDKVRRTGSVKAPQVSKAPTTHLAA
ncbi:efflux RND transporter permease subunit [Vitiosangium sp. GDMCC 1.1324]|uniref:efflux RND transporter permease subunit n=1 Tax=Vitiosangium sp. (strain GDMCC 1.1324) TaxID=2138576 RepID=UPI000D3658B5|nr:multidrug efflux RND transporter permease subunit [Vitiosangium sp. GDMCC 1.1324]PTL81533.1 hydrophobe/amphiphile efflux-1 family RND transporter [Vitiosangium sp. GDMCC 1.1324]